MKKITLSVALLLFGGAYMANAQVGIGTTEPHASALLHIDAKDKGVLIPNISLTALDAALPVGSPAESLLVYNTNETIGKGFYFWSANKWNRITDGTNINELITNYLTENTENNNNLGEVVKTHESKTVVVEVKEDNKLIGYNYFSEKAIQDNVPLTAEATNDNGVYFIDVAGIVTKFLDFDPNNPGETNTIINKLKEIIKAMESKTTIEKVVGGETSEGTVTVKYEYANEAHIQNPTENEKQTIDLTADVANLIKNNKTIKNEITTIINNNADGGGNVYYGPISDTSGDVLYRIDANGTKIEIDFLSNPEIINKIKEIVTIDYNITEGDQVVVTTNNKWVNGKDLKVWVKKHNQSTASSNFTVAGAPTNMNTIAKVTVISEDGKTNLGTFSNVQKNGSDFKFTSGIGMFSSSVNAGNYTILVEFTE